MIRMTNLFVVCAAEGGSNKEIAPRFMHKMMQGQVNMEELSLRPAANSMMFKKNANLPKPPLGMNTGG